MIFINDLQKFLDKQGIENKNHFLNFMDQNLSTLEKVLSSNDMQIAQLEPPTEKTIPLSKLVGCSEKNLNGLSLFENFHHFFDSNQKDGYHTRGLSLLDLNKEEILEKLKSSFLEEPIKTICIQNQYYINNNGLHRFMLLKLLYRIEMYQRVPIEELEQKYQIKVINQDLNLLKTFSTFLGNSFQPPILLKEDRTEIDWIEEIKKQIELLKTNPNQYQTFIASFSFSKFINNESGEVMIKQLFHFFPSLAKDVFYYLGKTNHYDCLVPFMECILKNYPEEKEQYIALISTFTNTEVNTDNSYAYIDLEKKWNNYGTVTDLTKLDKQQRNNKLSLFSEGSLPLEKCLTILWNLDIPTTACCKGNHMTVTYKNSPEVACEGYIAFQPNTNWKQYLSKEIIENKNVVLSENAIYYYGANHDNFFQMLARDFLTGQKKYPKELAEKLNKKLNSEEILALEYKSFIYSLEQIGFQEEQIHYLGKSYLEYNKTQKEYYEIKDIEKKKELLTKLKKVEQDYNADLLFYITRNNEALTNENSTHSR